LRKSTGKTQGIRLRMMPPMKARPMAEIAERLETVAAPDLAEVARGAAGATSPGTTGVVNS
jgi:hypothetical protein